MGQVLVAGQKSPDKHMLATMSVCVRRELAAKQAAKAAAEATAAEAAAAANA
jgi:hypothetical protein